MISIYAHKSRGGSLHFIQRKLSQRRTVPILGYRISHSLSDLAIARADGTHSKLFGSICKLKLLILDDWGLVPCTQAESREILEIVEERYNVSSCIIISQVRPRRRILVVLILE